MDKRSVGATIQSNQVLFGENAIWLQRIANDRDQLDLGEMIADFLKDDQYNITPSFILCRYLREMHRELFPEGAALCESTEGPLPEETDVYMNVLKQLAEGRDVPVDFKFLRKCLKKTAQPGRAAVFKWAFAFGMDAEYTAELLEAICEGPFNFRDAEEIIWYVGLKNQLPWQDCAALAEKCAAWAGQDGHAVPGQTARIHVQADAIHDLKELEAFLQEYHGILNGYSQTAYEWVYRLMDDLKELLRVGNEKKLTDIDLARRLWLPLWVTNADNTDFVSFRGLVDLPKAVTDDTLWRSRIKQLRDKKTPVKRKDIIFLNCMKYNLENPPAPGGVTEERIAEAQDNMKDFIQETDGILAECGLHSMYSPNPFDRLMMLAACSEHVYDVIADTFTASCDEEKLTAVLEKMRQKKNDQREDRKQKGKK